MNTNLKSALVLAAATITSQAFGQVTFYEREGFEGQSFNTEQQVKNFERYGFNDRASSAIVAGSRWEVCEDAAFSGRCVVLRPGRYASLSAMGLNNRVSSVRNVSSNARISERRYAPAAQVAQLTFYENEGFGGRAYSTQKEVGDFRRDGFNNRASSVVVTSGQWEVCDTADFRGRCVVLRPGEYSSLTAMGLNDRVSSVRVAGGQQPSGSAQPVAASATFYEREGFSGRTLSAKQDVEDFRRSGFNDQASSAVVTGGRWEVCDTAGFRGRCVVLSPGQYASLTPFGLNDRVSSVRSLGIGAGRHEAPPHGAYDYRRRDNEQLYEAPVTAVRAVVSSPEQRCWIEREQVSTRSDANVPAAIAGAVIGGILGHQVGDGRGQDLATAGGAVAGALVGANIGRDGGTQQQDVRRCTSVPSQARTDYWDVSYSFRGQDYRMQTSSPPGPTVTVNAQGEPRA